MTQLQTEEEGKPPDGQKRPSANTFSKTAKRIAVIYSDAKEEYFPTRVLYLSEKEVYDRALIVQQHLFKLGYEVKLFAGDANLTDNLKKFVPDKVINMVDSVYGKEYLAPTIPASLELLEIPYTGSGMLGQAINANKYLTKSLLSSYGVTTPKYQFIKTKQDDIDDNLDFPVIVKPNEIHGAVTINQQSICFNAKELKKQVNQLIDVYQQPVLAEEFIAGREIVVVVIDGGNMKLYSAERMFKNNDDPFANIVTSDDNWLNEEVTYSYCKYELTDKVKEDVKKIFAVTKMEDYAKFEFRLDSSGRHYLIDANSNPAIGPIDQSAMGNILDLYGLNFATFLKRLIEND